MSEHIDTVHPESEQDLENLESGQRPIHNNLPGEETEPEVPQNAGVDENQEVPVEEDEDSDEEGAPESEEDEAVAA